MQLKMFKRAKELNNVKGNQCLFPQVLSYPMPNITSLFPVLSVHHISMSEILL